MIQVKSHKRKGRIVKSHSRTIKKKGKFVPSDNMHFQGYADSGHLGYKYHGEKTAPGKTKAIRMNNAITMKGQGMPMKPEYGKGSKAKKRIKTLK